MSAPDSHQASPRPTVIEKHRCGEYGPRIDLWPDDWAASHCRAHVQTASPDDRQSSQCPLWGATLMHPAVKGHRNGDWYREVVQRTERLRLHSARPGRQGRVRAHQRRRAFGMRGLAEGQKVSYDVEADRRSGKESATNLRAA